MSDLPTATLGRTGVTVTSLGYGAMELRGGGGALRPGRRLDDDAVERLLHGVLDAGINLIDTSPDYGSSEEQIGRCLAGRRDEYFLASKCGCAVGEAAKGGGPGPHTFTRENVRAGVEQSLRRMRTDHLDLVQFHASPARSVLEEHDAVAELEALRDEGKVRFLGMSGTLPNLPDHIAMGVFDAFQIPYSAVEREHEQAISDAAAAGAGTIIRGGVARGLPEPPADLPKEYREYGDAMQARKEHFAAVDISDLLGDGSSMEFMLRFTLSHPGMHTTIVGTSNADHLAANVAAARKGPLPPDVYETARARFA
jgi:aryl-alcohol dehydrogenase-like predicted oxidoreductase